MYKFSSPHTQKVSKIQNTQQAFCERRMWRASVALLPLLCGLIYGVRRPMRENYSSSREYREALGNWVDDERAERRRESE